MVEKTKLWENQFAEGFKSGWCFDSRYFKKYFNTCFKSSKNIGGLNVLYETVESKTAEKTNLLKGKVQKWLLSEGVVVGHFLGHIAWDTCLDTPRKKVKFLGAKPSGISNFSVVFESQIPLSAEGCL